MKKYLLRSSIIILFLFSFIFKQNILHLISYINYIFTFNNQKTDSELLRIENLNLKKEINDTLLIKNITYNNLRYTYSKTLLNNIYDNKKLLINKGNKDLIKEKDLVINSDGLIGVISKVYKNTSEVDLLSNINISVKINKDYYILKYNDYFYVENLKDINKFDVVYTSGIANYPEGIVVGYVQSIINNKAYIKSKVNFERINYVVVVGL